MIFVIREDNKLLLLLLLLLLRDKFEQVSSDDHQMSLVGEWVSVDDGYVWGVPSTM